MNKRIGVWRPSKAVKPDQAVEVEKAIEFLKTQYGWDAVKPANWLACDNRGVAGSANERIADLNELLDKEVDAVVCVQGGENANELLDLIPYKDMIDTGTRLVGMSDCSLLVNVLASQGGQGILGPDLKLGSTGLYRYGNLNHPWTQKWFGKLFHQGAVTVDLPEPETHKILEDGGGRPLEGTL